MKREAQRVMVSAWNSRDQNDQRGQVRKKGKVDSGEDQRTQKWVIP